MTQDVTDRHDADREIAAHVALAEALAEREAFEAGARGLLARLGTALECTAGIFWVPAGDVLEPRVLWHASATEPTADATKPRAVKTHLQNIYRKLGVSDKPSALANALRLGIID